MATIAQAIIHVIGLAVYSSQVPNDCGLKVILPQVGHTEQRSAARTGTPTAVTPPFVKSHRVEDHVPILVFRTDSYVSSVNWGDPIPLSPDPVAPLQRTPNPPASLYAYVKLDGDHVRFDSGVPNQALNMTGLNLPPLQKLCPAMTSLNAGFQPPYSGAAAVIDLPQGTVNACFAGLRIDSEITLDRSGDLIVSASTMRVQKELRLKAVGGKLELIVANIPVSCLTGVCTPPDPSAIDNLSHVHAYYGMVDQSASCNRSIQQWVLGACASEKPQSTCTVVVPKAAGGAGMSEVMKTSDPVVNVTDFECSNSRWP